MPLGHVVLNDLVAFVFQAMPDSFGAAHDNIYDGVHDEVQDDTVGDFV